MFLGFGRKNDVISRKTLHGRSALRLETINGRYPSRLRRIRFFSSTVKFGVLSAAQAEIYSRRWSHMLLWALPSRCSWCRGCCSCLDQATENARWWWCLAATGRIALVAGGPAIPASSIHGPWSPDLRCFRLETDTAPLHLVLLLQPSHC